MQDNLIIHARAAPPALIRKIFKALLAVEPH
jgi:hypothetical protein